ncbi:hypothetical protein [Pseudomonas sp. NFIX28]|uniref:hypothetical protein n=1 Tax=Pseudomonas sp. NFIX28 TaxID=1566235 RepID=UPI0008960A3F|nr:hypothetical protein [Pseudomonas sp. NFIX28]SDZ25521.1 hypothetical protein SAMN03159453_02956 [Pseudomonas sp. NFIX28]
MHEQHDLNISVRTFWRVHGRKYLREFHIDLFELGIVSKSWVTAGLRLISQSSLGEPTPRDYLWCIVECIKLLAADSNASGLINLGSEEISSPELRDLFTILDDALLKSPNNTAEVKKKFSYSFRSFPFRYGLVDQKHINRDSVRYKSKIGKLKSLPRELLNDTPKNNMTHFEPMGAISHENYQDLVEKTLKKLNGDLQTIIDACLADIRAADELRQKIRDAESSPTPEAYIKIIERFVVKHCTTSYDHRFYDSIPFKHKLPSYLIALNNKKLFNAGTSWRSYKLSKLLNDTLVSIPPGFPPLQIMALSQRACTIEIQAIFILLLCRTGWNKSSLYNMELGMITKDEIDGHYELQGYKSKTDDLTPPVFIDSRELYYHDAVTMLLWNHSQLIKLGHIIPTEQRLWFTWTGGSTPYTEQTVVIQMATACFASRHNIFNFSYEQIRTQVGNIASCSLKSINEAQIIYGHKNIATTGHYLDQLLNHKLLSSMNLEFQRRLEKKILFNMNQSLSKNLIPIGDGALCSNPIDHPFKEIQGEGDCRAEYCHSGDGCINRVILINEERIAELIRTRNFFHSNWKDLHAENQENFKARIAPRIIFNSALYEFIKASAYGHILKKIEGTIDNER